MRKKIIAGVILVALLLVVNWFYSHATIEVVVAGTSTNDSFTYTLTDDAGKVITYKSSETTFKKTVSKGLYEVQVTSGSGTTATSTSFVKSVETGSFLATTTVQASLQPENERRFVGNNPDSCMYLSANKLFSNACGGSITDLKLHVPASATTPTFVRNAPAADSEARLGTQILQTKNGLLGFFSVGKGQALDPGHYVSIYTPDFELTATYPLSNLSKQEVFTAKAYKNGILLYNTDLSQMYYLASAQAKLQRITLDKPEDDKLRLAVLVVSNDTIVAQYTDQEEGQHGDGETPEEISRGKSEFVVFTDGSQQHYSFGKLFTDAEACGVSKLCLVAANRLEVYDIADGKAKLISRVSGIQDIILTGKTIAAFTSSGIYTYDPDTSEGHYSYSLGTYSYCGSSEAAGGYLVCVLAPKGGWRFALYVNLAAPNSGPIDKQILSLLDNTNIKTVSINDKFLFLVPEYGKATYNPAQRRLEYDPAQKQAVNQAITTAVDKAGINRSVYQVKIIGQ